MAGSFATNTRSASWSSLQAYTMALVCLALGVAIGYVVRGPANGLPAEIGVAESRPASPVDVQAAPLLAQLSGRPNDADVLARVGNIYFDAQQFQTATTYYEKALKLAPKNATVRADVGTSYYMLGDTERALAEYGKALSVDSGNANALFNTGLIKWQKQKDPDGAIAAWTQLLDKNPTHPRKAEVELMIRRVRLTARTTLKGQP